MGFILTWAEMNCDIAKHFYLPFFFKEIVKLCTNVIKNCSDCKSRQALLTEKRKPLLTVITNDNISVSEQNFS